MIRHLSTWLVVALAGVLIAGCGSSSSTSNSSTTAQAISVTQPTATAKTSTSPTTTPTPKSPPATSSVPTSPVGVAQAVAECKAILQRDPTLSASLKSKVEGICNKAASGNLAAARTAAKEVCAEVINASPIPSVAKAQALAACQHS
jgi:hypothetical protein